MVILGRTYADGTEADYKAVNALQAQYKITPLSSWGKPYTPVAPPVNPNPGFSMTDKPLAAFGWPANQERDAVYPNTEKDSTGQKLSGANKYTLTFAKDATPPVNGFWSFTMYMIDQGWWFVPNPLNRFTVSMRDNPKFNPDGSLTLYFQNESPGADELAAGAQGRFCADAANVLAQGHCAFDHRRKLESAVGDQGRLIAANRRLPCARNDSGRREAACVGTRPIATLLGSRRGDRCRCEADIVEDLWVRSRLPAGCDRHAAFPSPSVS